MSRAWRKWSGWPWWVVGKSFEAALEAKGYTVIMAVGFGERIDGTYSIKLASSPLLRGLSEGTWRMTRETIIRAMDRMRESPLDDLEIE